MIHEPSTKQVTVSRPKITLLMVLCGVVGVAAAGAVSAASNPDDGQGFSIKFAPESLTTDAGVRALFTRIVKASEDVCPIPTGTRVISSAVKACRAKAVASVVHQINNPRLAALLADSSKSG
jgi:UrcA family protein